MTNDDRILHIRFARSGRRKVACVTSLTSASPHWFSTYSRTQFASCTRSHTIYYYYWHAYLCVGESVYLYEHTYNYSIALWYAQNKNFRVIHSQHALVTSCVEQVIATAAWRPLSCAWPRNVACAQSLWCVPLILLYTQYTILYFGIQHRWTNQWLQIV